MVCHHSQSGTFWDIQLAWDVALGCHLNRHKRFDIFDEVVLDIIVSLAVDVPNQKAFIVCLAVVLLDSGTTVADSSALIEDLIGLVDVAQHSVVKLIKHFNVVVAVVHHPAEVCLTIINCSVIKSDVDGVRVGRVFPVGLVKD